MPNYNMDLERWQPLLESPPEGLRGVVMYSLRLRKSGARNLSTKKAARLPGPRKHPVILSAAKDLYPGQREILRRKKRSSG